MTDHTPLTDQQRTPAEIRLAQYGERTSTWSTATYNDGTEKALHEIALGLKAEIDRLRGQLAREENLHGETIDDRDRMHEAADKLAYAVAPIEVIGEHSSMNDPWENALDHLTPATDVAKLRARIAELEGPAVEARAALAALCYDLEDPGSNALGALYLLSQATVGVEAPKDDTAAALGMHTRGVLRRVADMADPEAPEVSFFGGMVGPSVAAWLRMIGDHPESVARLAAVPAAVESE